jgi:PAS domain S-box-containing protein
MGFSSGVSGVRNLALLGEDGQRILYRGWRDGADGARTAVLAVLSASEHPAQDLADRLTHEYGLKDELDGRSAVRPLALVREQGRIALLLADPGGEPLDRFLGRPMEMRQFLDIAIGLSAALRSLHERGLIHKDIKPANVLVNPATGEVWLMGFGIASRLPRERQSPEPPEFIAGSLPYMAPEQTGRMNRSVDSRADLYALGVTLYEMLTGALPFSASDPMEWVHCHIARQPVPPTERAATVPPAVSAIVLKLLTKAAEQRYQTAAGTEADLRRCRDEWELHGRIDAFALGSRDTPDRLLIPEKLYGRDREIGALIAAFDRVVAEGTPELVLVSGYSGVGKSSVVNELHKVLVPPRGLFAAGKFDQYKRDIPYATLAQALRTLVRQILVKSEAEVDKWRRVLTEAVEPHGQLIVGLVPEVEFIIGKQPPVAELPPRDAQNRFQLVFRRFLGAFATAEHPLALFLDDLQWLDAATLELLEHIVTQADVRHLLLVGAFRNNEVTPSHPLMRTLEAIRKAGARVQDIVLTPLARADIGQLVADAMQCAPDRVRPLAHMMHEKTSGNPFFAIQFFTALAEEGSLAFDPAMRTWQWDIERIQAKSYTDNVVDLMAGKLKRFSPIAQEALKQLASLGNVAPAATLALVHGTTEQAIEAALWEAVRAGLVSHQGDTWRFLHDRIQQAAYSLTPEEERPGLHLHIGRTLLANMTADALAEQLFDVANQLNRGATLLVERDEKALVATLDLRAGRKAKASAAYASARSYFAAGMALLDESDWISQYELAFSLTLERAECEYLTGNFDEAERFIADLLTHASSRIDKAAAYRLKIDLHVMKSENPKGVEAALDCLRLFGIEMSPHPSREQFDSVFTAVWRALDGRQIESLIDLPRTSDAEVEAAMRVLQALYAPAYFTDEMLLHVELCHMVALTLERGVTDTSPHGFAWFGVVLGHVLGKYADGYQFGCLANALIERHGFAAHHKAKALLSLEVLSVWTLPISLALDIINEAFTTALESGDIATACYASDHIVTDLLLRGDHLDDVLREAERSFAFVRNAKFQDVVDILVSQQRFIENMRGETTSFSTFDGPDFDEDDFEARLTPDRMAMMVYWYWVIKGKARFLSGDFEEAAQAFARALPLAWSSSGHIQLLDYHFFLALTLAAQAKPNGSSADAALLGQLMAHRDQIRRWSESCPATFANKHALVSAEIARVEARDIDAMRLYEEAIGLARKHGFVHDEAIANQLAARFYATHGIETTALLHLRNARDCYLRWGAKGKVRQLDLLHPNLITAQASSPASADGAPMHQLDVASIVKASQAVSSEIVLPRLIERLMTIAIENAGADRGLLILPAGQDYAVQAEAEAAGGQVDVVLRERSMREAACPESIVRYVIRTHESVIIDDAARPNLFSDDPYLRGAPAKSILCLPLMKQRYLTGLLYLENTLASHAFAHDRIAVVELLAAQAAISLENTRLYGELQEREAKVRRLVDSNIIGVFVWDIEGRIIEANQAFLNMIGYDHDEVASGRVDWAELTPAEWRPATERAIAELKATGSNNAFEKEYLRKDGSRVPVLVGAATFRSNHDQGVAFVLDLSERKEAERRLQESGRRYNEAQAELAHVTRVTMLGELTASISHEVSQPITAIATRGSACLLNVRRETPDLDAVRRAVEGIVKDANRAAQVIQRVRGLVKKSDTQMAPLDVNDTINETVALLQPELNVHGVSLRRELAPAMPLAIADRVQLQQVLINLIMNGIEAMQPVADGPRQLELSSRQDESGQIQVSVKDTGVGISSEAKERVFEAFFTTKSRGMGMGLSICRGIIEAHGGRLWVEPNVPRGTAFHFTLPPQPQGS